MNTKTVYSTKAEKYAKYRWDYAPQAIQTMIEINQMADQWTLADLGAGTGILTRHFIDKVKRIYAIEPNVEMMRILAREMQSFPSVSVLDVSAENTTLPDHSVDVITVAQAIHFFGKLEARARQIFSQYSQDGYWLMEGETELIIGQPLRLNSS